MSDMLYQYKPTITDIPLRRTLPFRRPLISPSFPESSSFLKSFVFCARSLRWTVESLWYWTISDAVLSKVGIRDVRSISTNVSIWLCLLQFNLTSPRRYSLLKFVVSIVGRRFMLLWLLYFICCDFCQRRVCEIRHPYATTQEGIIRQVGSRYWGQVWRALWWDNQCLVILRSCSLSQVRTAYSLTTAKLHREGLHKVLVGQPWR